MSIPYTHIDPNMLSGGLVGSPTEWESNGSALGHIPQTSSVGTGNKYLIFLIYVISFMTSFLI